MQSTKIAIVILAAGESSRLGYPKQLLLDKEGKSLIKRICTIATQVDLTNVICVLGSSFEEVIAEIDTSKVIILKNESWRDGISTSIYSAIKYIKIFLPETEVCILLVCDQPYITSKTLESLIETFYQTNKKIIASKYGNVIGTPVLFEKIYFPDLLKLIGDKGAGKLIKEKMHDVATIDFPEGAIDIDNKEEYFDFISV